MIARQPWQAWKSCNKSTVERFFTLPFCAFTVILIPVPKCAPTPLFPAESPSRQLWIKPSDVPVTCPPAAPAAPSAFRTRADTQSSVAQLLQFIVSADAINLLHRDIKMKNMFVVQAHSLENARLAVGDFGAAQRGVETVRRSG